jgi:hypothetical protein
LDLDFSGRVRGNIAMAIEWAQWVVACLGVYLGAGAAFALYFTVAGPGRIDIAAERMPWAARFLILPGVVALWPLMLAKWFTQREAPQS